MKSTLIERTIPMDTTDTTSSDLVLIDAGSDQMLEDTSFSKEVTKTLLVSTATSAGVFGGFVVIALLTPHVKAWFNRKKNNAVVIEGESLSEDTPEKN